MKIVSAQVTDRSEQWLQLSDLPLPLGRSEAMRRVHDQIRRLASTDTTTLIYGETGTGKELVAMALHRLSRRGSGPYLCVNCGGLPDGLVESELFGHVKGAFTGAFQERTGRFEAAHGGTLFLDEIGDISPAVQIRFLRVLETKCVEPVGSHRARNVDVRILAATNKPLRDEVGAGRFRSDLYYRLNVAMIELPPLRDRREDIPLLARYFLDELGRRSRRGAAEISTEAMEVLMHHGWPGNVRELRNAIEYASVHAQTDVLRAPDLPQFLNDCGIGEPFPERRRGDRRRRMPEDRHLGTLVTAVCCAELDGPTLERLLDANRWHVGHTAAYLGVHRTTLWRHMQRLGLIKDSES
ncbi:MAG: sigma-54 dependent transcriptional regulator [Pseudomonadota bacterium]|nr:sigma-54 dependent transcriptional regulator [Pseudomonadota bacterium]